MLQGIAPAFMMIVASMLLTAQDGPPLPASLMTLRLESGYLIDLGELARGGDPLTLAAEPMLTVHSPLIRCGLEWVAGEAEPHAAHNTAVASDVERLASQLPAGFGTPEMYAQRIPVNCSAAVNGDDDDDDEQNGTLEAAALELCLFFASAPALHRRVSLYWPEYLPLYVDLSLALACEEPGSTALSRQGRVAFERVESLAEQLQRCAVTMDTSVAMHKDPAGHMVVSRL